MAKNSRTKGARNELAAAKLLTELGYPARRAQQYQGLAGHGDIEFVEPEINAILAVEVKSGQGRPALESKLMEQWREQAAIEANGKQWIILHKPDREPWRFVFRVYPDAPDSPLFEVTSPEAIGAIMDTIISQEAK